MGLSEEIDKSTKSEEKLPLKYYIWERRKDVRDTLQLWRYIRTKWWRKKIIKTKIKTKQKYKIEWQEKYYDEIIQEPEQENIKVRKGKKWWLLGPDLSPLLITKYESADHKSYEWKYIVTNNSYNEIIYKWKKILKTKKINTIESRNLRELWIIFLVINKWNIKSIEENGEIKKFVETTIFDKNWKKMLGPTNIICINNKPVIDSIESWLLVKTDSWRIITQDNENPIILEDIILRYINKKPTIIWYKQNWKRHKKEKAPYFTPKEIIWDNNAA